MTMRRNRFEYFLNAVHYGIWLYQKKMGDKIDRQWSSFIRILTKYFPEKWRNKILACDELSKKKLCNFIMTDKTGYISNGLLLSLVCFIPVILHFCHLCFWGFT